MEVSGDHQLFGNPCFLENIFFWVQQKTEIHRGLEQLEGGKMTFWVYCPFHDYVSEQKMNYVNVK